MRVVVAEDLLLTRVGIVRLLQDAGVEVVAEATDLPETLDAVALHRPDVAVLDIRMPPTHTNEGLTAASLIRRDQPGTGVLLLSQYVEAGYALKLLEEFPERVGYLMKERVLDGSALVDALHRITDGECVVDPTIVSRLLGRRRRQDPLERLSAREREVLALLAEGLSNAAIAQRLTVTERTVEAHITALFDRLDLGAEPGTNRRVLAVLAFLRSGGS
jgi:DNA-binding NarL/FixJ family response regulator